MRTVGIRIALSVINSASPSQYLLEFPSTQLSYCDVTMRTVGIRIALSVINSVSPSQYLLEFPIDTAVLL